MELEEYKEIVNCNCGKCLLRKEVYNETLEYLDKTFPKKKTIDKLPFLHFRLYSPNLSLGQALAAFSFEESETIN